MKINETQEKEIATRLGLTKPICPKDVADYVADQEAFREAVSNYERPNFSWRATTQEARATIEQARTNLTKLEELADKADNHSDTVALATTAFQDQTRKYWNAIETEANRPRLAFDKERDEFVASMDKEKRSLKRKQSKVESTIGWQTEEYKEITERLSLVGYMAEQARYLNYDPDTCPAFTELVLWEQIAKSEDRANRFLEFVSKVSLLAN